MVKVFTCLCQASTVPWTQCVFLQHQSLTTDFLQDWQHQIQVLLALLEVLDLGIRIVYDTFAFVGHLSLTVPHHILNALDKFTSHIANQCGLFLETAIKNFGALHFTLLLQVLKFCLNINIASFISRIILL